MNYRRAIMLVGLLALITGAGAASAWNLRQRSDRLCRASARLARQAPLLQSWLVEFRADPFLAAGGYGPPLERVFSLLEAHSRLLEADWSARLLPEEARQAFRLLPLASAQAAEAANALQSLRELPSRLQCREPENEAEGADLALAMRAATDYWVERRAEAARAKAEFGGDRQIFCRGEDLLLRLRRVAEAARLRCKHPHAPAARKKGCAPGKNQALDAEILDLEAQRELNLRKLQRKWPAAVVGEMKCST